jgi:hypothetical protein
MRNTSREDIAPRILKPLGQRMSEAIHPLSQNVFMAWCLVKAQGQLYRYLTIWRWVVSFTPRPLYSREKVPGNHYKWRLLGLTAGLDVVTKSKKSLPLKGIERSSSSPQTSRCTDWATAAKIICNNMCNIRIQNLYMDYMSRDVITTHSDYRRNLQKFQSLEDLGVVLSTTNTRYIPGYFFSLVNFIPRRHQQKNS